MAKQISIGGRQFASMKECREWYSFMLNIRDVGDRLDSTAHRELLALLKRHPEAERKIGCGVAFFTVEKNPSYPTRCFIIHRKDGSTTDFSYLCCVKGAEPNPIAERKEAFRVAIRPQIKAARARIIGDAANGYCALTGKLIAADAGDIHHVKPFARLLEDFMAQNDIFFFDIEISESADNQYEPSLADPELEASWCRYHQRHAKLVFVDKSEHRKL